MEVDEEIENQIMTAVNAEDIDHRPEDACLDLITDLEYPLSELRNFLSASCLSARCSFMDNLDDDLEEVHKNFVALITTEDFNLAELSVLLVAVAKLYFTSPCTALNLTLRNGMLHRAFQIVDTLNPIHIHILTKHLWDAFQTNDVRFAINILTLCGQLALASPTGKAIAISLAWTLICEISENECQLYCFREIRELVRMLKDVDDDMLALEESAPNIYILVQAVTFIVSTQIMGHNELFCKVGYIRCFNTKESYLLKMRDWGEHLKVILRPLIENKANKFRYLHLVTNQYLNNNVMEVLKDKMAIMQGGAGLVNEG